MIEVTVKGDYKNTSSFLERTKEIIKLGVLNKYGRVGVEALQNATPRKTGLTANSWSYEIERKGKEVSIIWKNSNVNDGHNIALLIQYGHGTGTGGYVRGVDYINPALKPVFEQIEEEMWKELKDL